MLTLNDIMLEQTIPAIMDLHFPSREIVERAVDGEAGTQRGGYCSWCKELAFAENVAVWWSMDGAQVWREKPLLTGLVRE